MNIQIPNTYKGEVKHHALFGTGNPVQKKFLVRINIHTYGVPYWIEVIETCFPDMISAIRHLSCLSYLHWSIEEYKDEE